MNPDQIEQTITQWVDGYMMKNPQLAAFTHQSAQVLPQLHQLMMQHPQAPQLQQILMHDIIIPLVQAIQKGDMQSAVQLYQKLVQALMHIAQLIQQQGTKQPPIPPQPQAPAPQPQAPAPQPQAPAPGGALSQLGGPQ